MDGEEGNEGNGDGPTAAQIAVKRILLDNELVVRSAKDFLPVNKRLVCPKECVYTQYGLYGTLL